MKATEMPVSKHVANFITKLVIIGLICAIVLPNFSMLTINDSLVTALVLALIAYAVGDLFILPAYGNPTATVADAVLSAVVIYIADLVVNGAMTLSALGWILAIGIIALGEWFFHRYLKITPAPVKEDMQ
ncbi:MAG: DUF2512 family protein [Desulfotomaculaceae bacterium]|nr:DUF2512 family protein [Desulfotomaculaceae bacterium]